MTNPLPGPTTATASAASVVVAKPRSMPSVSTNSRPARPASRDVSDSRVGLTDEPSSSRFA